MDVSADAAAFESPNAVPEHGSPPYLSPFKKFTARMGTGTEADWAKEARFRKVAGASHLRLTTTFDRRRHKRIPGHGMGDHMAALRRYHAASPTSSSRPPGPARTLVVAWQSARFRPGARAPAGHRAG